MRRALMLILAVALALGLAWPAIGAERRKRSLSKKKITRTARKKAAKPVRAGVGPVWVIEMDDTVNPGTAEYLVKGLKKAQKADAACVVIRLDTPGGLVTSMRRMVRGIMDSSVPVVVFVAPSGARAASAGAFLLLSGHIAAMSPASNVGAASPVAGGGQDVKGTMAKKATADLVAFITSIANERGRNALLARTMVTKAASFDAQAALKQNLVDLIAASLGELLKEVEGKVVKTKAGQRRIVTAGKPIHFHSPGLRERLLSILANPNLAYILLMIGLAGLYFELSNPGAIVPGVVGGLSLILAFFAMSTLPVSVAGLALIALSAVLFIMEIKIVSYGMLSVAAAISLLLGSLMLFESDDDLVRISLSVLIPTVVAVIAFFVAVTYLAVRAQLRKSSAGSEGLLGARGVVVDRTTVRVMGELWRAKGAGGLAPGSEVMVKAVEGLLLTVEPLHGEAPILGG